MKKLIFGVLAGLVLAMNAVSVNAADVDNYSITNYEVKMTLGRDAENRSTLQTVETITAQFPDFDQNHGLEKVFVREYNGHPTSLNLVSVTDENGVSLPYGWNNDALRIGEADKYVHGQKTYVITYTQRDVTRHYADTGNDEFYWDVIGTEWRVPIEKAKVVLTVEDGDETKVVSGPFCYRGVGGSTNQCNIRETPNSLQDTPSLIYTAQTSGIGNGQGVTLALGFEKGTFAEYKMSLFEKIVAVWTTVQVAMFGVGLAVFTFVMIRWQNLLNRKKEMGTIVPEYLPPKNASVTVAAKVGGYHNSIMSAQLIDLAVRHYIKIYEVKEKSTFRPAEYEIEIIKDIGDLKWEEQELLKDTFGGKPTTVGQRLNLKELQNNTAYYKRTLNNDRDMDKLIKGEYGLRERDENTKKWGKRLSLAMLILGLMTLSPFVLILALITFLTAQYGSYRLSDEGLALRRYLKGLKMYIGVAEEERLKMLQSPEGAEKVASVTNGTDGGQLVKLYEKVLPYAILFGQEKQWNKQIGSYYEASGSQPDWYAGRSGVYNAAAFSSAMSSFSSASSSASSASSSSGGSSGGGSAGGGGGGGGGGGW